MKPRIPISIAIFLSSIFLGGCSLLTKTPEVNTSEFLPLFEEQITASNTEDIELAMKGIHPESAGYTNSRQGLLGVFDKYDLQTKLVSWKVIGASPEELKIEVVQEARDTQSQTDFAPTQTTAIYALRKSKGEWKIFDVKIVGTEYIN